MQLPGYPAVWSPCRKYRYTLWRVFSEYPPKNFMAVIGLNPSTATELEDDPTVNRCWKLAKREGFDAFCMLNIFALRSTDPQQLYKSADPIGAENDRWIIEVTQQADIVVAAWGVHGAFQYRGRDVRQMILDLKCLGITKHGHPRHPLYLRKDVEIIQW